MGVVDKKVHGEDVERLQVLGERDIAAEHRYHGAELDAFIAQGQNHCFHKVIENTAMCIAIEFYKKTVCASVSVSVMELEDVNRAKSLRV